MTDPMQNDAALREYNEVDAAGPTVSGATGEVDVTGEAGEPDDMDPATLSDFAYDLSPSTHVRFLRRGAQLLVTFDAVANGPAAAAIAPELEPLALDLGWSVLSLTSTDAGWFRDAEVVTFFDALADGTLLDQFDTVEFYGAGPAAYAALCYALTAPQAHVLALAPVIPPEPPSRYAPDDDNLGAAAAICVIGAVQGQLDLPDDALHLRHGAAGVDAVTLVRRLELLERIAEAAMAGKLDALSIATMLRERRDNLRWIRMLDTRLADRPLLRALLLRSVTLRMQHHRYKRRLEELEAELTGLGIALPPVRTRRV